MASRADFEISTLGRSNIDSPLLSLRYPDGRSFNFTSDDDRMILDHNLASLESELKAKGGLADLPSLERAGPRSRIFFDPGKVTAGIVTCGGLCPGLNNVIRDVVMTAVLRYGVRSIIGFRYGYRGLVETESRADLTPELVANIHKMGGTILGTSRGPQEVGEMVDSLVRLEVDILFAVGGDGTMKGAIEICQEIRRRKAKIAVVGIPKTIDNDLDIMDRSFGYMTAYSKALEAIDSAHREAEAAPNGLGLVKLMGRHSGFIACAATLASNQVNFTLIPEVPFRLEGSHGLLEALRKRFERRNHAVVVVAEGAGQDLLNERGGEKDPSGNVKLRDVGPYLADRIKDYFESKGVELTLKYIDPSYMIRSLRAAPPDSVLCTNLAENAVHAAMCGKTEMVVALWHNTLVHIPMRQVVRETNVVDPAGELWLSVLGTTGQPLAFY